MNISNVNIVKRTFEGINDNPITSKYYPSKKYAVVYDIEGYAHNPSVHCTTTKKNAQLYIDELKRIHNVN